MTGQQNIDAWLEAGRMADGVRMSDERLDEVFNLVRTPGNWKMPIDAFVPTHLATVAEIEKAVIWYAGGVPEFVAEHRDGVPGHRVIGAGYYAWIGA